MKREQLEQKVREWWKNTKGIHPDSVTTFIESIIEDIERKAFEAGRRMANPYDGAYWFENFDHYKQSI